MEKERLFDSLLLEMRRSLTLSPDQPDETPESTLRALWHAASGDSCSAKRAQSMEPADLTEERISLLHELIGRRLSGIPLSQITGRAHFMGLELEFGPGVCVIRKETELLGESAVGVLAKVIHPVIVDIGCGSGNLTCGICHALPGCRAFAVDVLESGVKLTKKNAGICGIADRVSVMQGDLFGPLESMGIHGVVDAVVCNPPYIASSRLKGDRAYLLDHEPREAFDGGAFGFALHQRLIRESLRFLKPNAALLFEFGAGQDKQVQGLFNRSGGYGIPIEFVNDAAGTPRVAIARKLSIPVAEN